MSPKGVFSAQDKEIPSHLAQYIISSLKSPLALPHAHIVLSDCQTDLKLFFNFLFLFINWNGIKRKDLSDTNRTRSTISLIELELL